MRIIARFSEHERYDINEDRENVVFIATTSKGSYFCEVPRETSSRLREQREQFKQTAAERISLGLDPGEIRLA